MYKSRDFLSKSRRGILVFAVYGDTRKKGTWVHRKQKGIHFLFAIPTPRSRALMVAGLVSLCPKYSILCLLVSQSLRCETRTLTRGQIFYLSYRIFMFSSGCPEKVVLGPAPFGTRHIKTT
jgi:hypothetical protein